MTIYLKLFHGRNSVDEEMDDWGFEGPTLGPFQYIHVTYMSNIKFSMEREAFKLAFPEIFEEWHRKGYSNVNYPWIEWHLDTTEDLVKYQGQFFGDWSVTAQP